MIKMLAGVTAALAVCLGTGVAAAAPGTYEVSGTWTLTVANGQPAIQPDVKDDTVEVTCRGGDRMRDFSVSDQTRVAGAWRRVDGTGVQVEPKLTRTGDQLTVTATCQTG